MYLPFILAAALAGAPAPIVVIDGRPAQFDQPAVERAGRVYVPLRGVFERLGASVVYEEGTVNATRGGHTVQVRVGSVAALVDQVPRQLDAPPFSVGGRILVPLRFISQALGASVDYSRDTRTVSVASAVTAAAPMPTSVVITPVPVAVAITVAKIEPAVNANVRSKRPHIAATFGETIDPNLTRILFDDRDVTANAYVADRAITFDPAYDVPVGTHTVAIRGRARSGAPIAKVWSFTTSIAPVVQSGPNFLTDIRPRYDERVGGGFLVSGRTQANSRVHVTASASGAPPGGRYFHQGDASADIIADSSGRFTVAMTIAVFGNGVIDIRITAVDVAGNSAAAESRARF